MVVKKDPKIDKQREAEQAVSTSEYIQKERLLKELQKESASIVTLAYMYAKNFEETGADVTRRWATMEQQNAILQKVYNKGYKDGLQQGKGGTT